MDPVLLPFQISEWRCNILGVLRLLPELCCCPDRVAICIALQTVTTVTKGYYLVIGFYVQML
ncbi:hypothetical protein BS78_09G158400 [Paspalum vaginatum]|nr:hypothetical protein BS78_09G158400 [Paspalum vaginatum]